MAGKIKSLSRSDGVTTAAPTSLAFSGKLDSATVGGDDNDGTDGYLLLEDQSSDPSATTGDDIKVFCKDKGLYKVDSTGVATEIGSGTGSGELNYISNPSAAVDITGWTESTDGAVDVSRTTTASELPRENLTGSGIKIVGTAAATGEYVAFDFNLDDADLSKLLKIKWEQKPISGYTAGDFDVVIYDLDNAAEIIPAITEIPNATKTFETTFLSDSTSTNYELRIKSTVATTAGIVISDVIVGPGTRSLAIDPRWPSYDESDGPTLSGTGYSSTDNATYIPFQDSNGNWFLDFTIAVTVSSATRTAFELSLSGTDILDTNTIYGFTNINGASGYANSSTDVLRLQHSSGTTTFYWFGGRVSLASKPTWATKTAPDIYLAGMPDTDALGGDWEALSGVTGSWTTNTTYDNWFYRRDGQDAVIRGRILLSGAPDTATLTIDPMTSLGKNYNESLLTSSQLVGTAYLRDDGTATNRQTALVYANGSSQNFAIYGISNAATAVNATSPFTWASGDYIWVDIRVPISGWTTKEYLANAITGFNTATADRPGLVSSEQYEELDISSSGDFNAAQPVLRISKVGPQVTLTWDALTFSPASGTADSASGFIPSAYLPEHTIRGTTYTDSTAIVVITIFTTGIFRAQFFQTNSGAAYTSGTSVPAGSFSWNVDQ